MMYPLERRAYIGDVPPGEDGVYWGCTPWSILLLSSLSMMETKKILAQSPIKDQNQTSDWAWGRTRK